MRGICRPAYAGITLGLTGQDGFSTQMGKNEAFNHAGNFDRIDCRRIAWRWGIGGIFILMACTMLLTLFALLAIRRDIDNARARGLSDGHPRYPTSRC
jgi:hypothetical protein